jgi:single-strand DNA-binding protein
LANLNQIYLLGNLTRDPELRYTNEGMAITEMGMAVNKRWKDANGDENSVVDFFNITVWNHLAENCAGSLKKGDRVMIGGHLNLRSWENKDGKKYNIVNITADVAALSLEFNKANNHEGKTNGANNYEGRPERINGSESRSEEENSSIGPNRTHSIESPGKINGSESRSERSDRAIGRVDKMDNGGVSQDGKNKKKDQGKKPDSMSVAQDLAADYSLEVISK